MPQHAGGEHTYKIEPLPFGLTGKNIQQWASLYSWHIQVGPKSWIVSTAQNPVDPLVLFNSQPIIARLLPPRTQTRHQSVLAGPKPQKGQGKGVSMNGPNPEVSTLDPWAVYSATHPHMSQAHAATARNTDGPIEAKFKQQENRITQLEATLQTVAEDQLQTDKQFETVKQQNADTKACVTHTIEQAKHDIQCSVAQALDQQSQQLSNSLAEIKSLFQKQAKRSRENEAEDMES